MNKVTIFKYEESKLVRTLNLNGEPWFVLRDVCEVLGLGNSRMVADRLDEDEKGVSQIDTLGGVQNATIISESGLYNVILRSDKPEAKPFRKWVTAVVLPSIRKNGGYIAGQEELSPQELMAKALLVCVPIVTACIKKGIAVAVDAINAQTQNIKVQRLVREIGDAVANAVAAMNQTYVNDLKAAGTFNEAEQKEALMRAVSAALKSMSRDAQDYIKSNFGDTTQYLENRIEAQIDANHVAAKQAAVQNTLNLG